MHPRSPSGENQPLDKTLISLLSGASALALLGGSQASAAPAVDEVNVLQPAQSFGELLDPIPDAENLLKAENERDAAVAAEEKPLIMAQYYHHHHHHHYYHHHHHYHHHHYHHHHHHHHHYHHHYY
jgi:hypothetical protein